MSDIKGIPGVTELTSSGSSNPPPMPTVPQNPDLLALMNLPMEEQMKLINKARAPEQPATTPPQTSFATPISTDPKPLKLTYKFTGNCSECKGEVETLEIDANEKHFVNAFCIRDHKQLLSFEVADLNTLVYPQIVDIPAQPAILQEEEVKDVRHDIPNKKPIQRKV